MIDTQVPAAPRASAARQNVVLFLLLMAASTVASVAVLPYAAILTRQDPGAALTWPSILTAVVGNAILIVPLTALGLWLGGKIGLGAPDLRALLARSTDAGRLWRSAVYLPAVIGLSAGVVIMAAGGLFQLVFPAELPQMQTPPWWYGVLVAYAAGVNEEVMLRLGLMTILAWIGVKLAGDSQLSPAVGWTANVVTALAFGALHLPLAAAMGDLTASVVVRTLMLNVIAGLVFGWLYWRRGLLAAVVAHVSVDIVLHVLAWFIVPGTTA